MQVINKSLPDSLLSLTIVADQKELDSLKQHVLGHFADKVKLPGFRSGKAPLSMVEKQIDSAELQNEFLEEAVNHLYQKAATEHKVRPLDRPEILIKKFVPFTTLEFEAKILVIEPIELADYKHVNFTRPKVSVTDKDVTGVIESLKTRLAQKTEVKRAAKKADELTIDFKGVDKNGQPISGADSKDYPLILGSQSFIPGFEDELVGLKQGDQKVFTVKFPKDYGLKSLANRDVEFTVDVIKVQEFEEMKLDDKFAAKAGPFKSIVELKADIKKQLLIERRREAERNFESEIVKQITVKSKVNVPQKLIEEQIERTLEEMKRDLVYRGQTYQEYLEQEGIDDSENRKKLTPGATERVKAGLVLSEISEREDIKINNEELDARMEALKVQYKDEQMQAELNKPEARQDIASRLITEKTLDKLVFYVDKNN